jgi:hypothetical protein
VANQSDVRRIALSLPESREEEDRFAFSVRNGEKFKAFAWVWNERVQPKKPRVANPDVLAVRVRDEIDKQALLDLGIEAFFTEPHYNNFPAILVRLESVGFEELVELVSTGWRCQAPPSLVKRFDEGRL